MEYNPQQKRRDLMSKMQPVYVDAARLSPEQCERLLSMDKHVILVEGNPHDCIMDNEKMLRDEFAMAFISAGEGSVAFAYKMADEMLTERSKKNE